jgi:hypothetical protein
MNAKLSIGLLATLGVPVLLASALAQQQGNNSDSQSGGSPGRFRVEAPASAESSSLGVISESPPRFAPYSTLPISVLTEDVHGYGTTYTLSNASTRNAESLIAHRADELAKKLGEAKSDTERSQIKTELTDLLEKQFGLRQKRHQEEIAGLEAKVKKLKELVEKRQENRREIIAKRLDQILSNAEGLGW